MRLIVCVLLPLLAYSAPADLLNDSPVSDESLKPLIRTKRADEEILFGNHQNEARIVKKADPSLPVVNEEAVIDNDLADPNEDVMPKSSNNPDVNEIFSDDAKYVGDLTEEEQPEEENAPEMDNFLPNDNGIDALGHNTEETREDESSGDLADEENMSNMVQNEDYKDYYDYFYPYAGINRYRRSNSEKRKRALPEKQLLTAEGMSENVILAKNGGANQRVKRDLTADEIYEWLENGGGAQEVEEEPIGNYIPEYDTENFEDENNWKNTAIEQLLEEEYPEEIESSEGYPSYQDYGEDYPESNPDMLSLLEYLVENEAPEPEVNLLGQMYPETIQEQWEDLDLDSKATYEPIVYEGVPGIFIPMFDKAPEPVAQIQKRQYLSMLPGLKKREEQAWYPYNREPEGGRWGAFVTPEEEKRTSDAYERLYRLAEALNPENQDYYK